MPKRVVKKEKQELTCMELIIKLFDDVRKKFDNIIKYDGITIEFTCKNEKDITTAIQLVEYICKNNKLISYVIEKSKSDLRKFILQFPDFTPAYTEDEIQKMYIANFKWLLDDAFRNKPDLTKSFILENTAKYVKLAVITYYRSNVNQYKEKLDDYLTNTIYRQKLNVLFMTYIDEYWVNKGIKE